ncbi:LEC14B protein [Penicillium macrosclerotiorum]|uniref:LEC14B protein n=1 Tax=Penicillium macrosclerotiorum TaxID=303699 RepID=UPI002546836F|nr:LEC14B protein [Penicillium macrosclerotiorum]KAJ5692356.1 LEC14B protein [Penicillium macrosclerotiorum]
MSELIGKLMVSLNQHVQGPGQTIVDFNEYLNYLAFDVIGDYAFGKPFGFLDREKDHLNLIATIDARGEVLNALGHLPQFVRPMMKCFVMDPFWPNGLRATSNLATFGTSAFCQRRDQQNSRKDLLSFLFEAVDPDSGLPLTEKEIIAESISFIVGGSDTTSSTMTNVVDIVSRLPDIQNKLQEELDREFPSQVAPDWAADYKTINQLPVLNAVVRETMRFRPTSSTGLERVTPKGGKIIAGKFIPEDTLVSVPTLNIHHDPGVFADPGQFDISRWLNDSSPELLDSFYPFSLGPRACIGRNFAWMEMLKTLATIFKVYRIERAHLQDTQVREGFFVKNSECRVTRCLDVLSISRSPSTTFITSTSLRSIMASPRSPPNEAGGSAEDQTIWHPAQEWLEEVEMMTDQDYQPSPSTSDHDDEWEDEMDEEDEEPSIENPDGNDGTYASDIRDALLERESSRINLGNIQIEITTDDSNDGDAGDGDSDYMRISGARLFHFLTLSGLRDTLRANGWPPLLEGEEEIDDEDDSLHTGGRPRGRRHRGSYKWPEVPSSAGTDLMGSGIFGTNQYYVDRIKKRKQAFATKLMWRELGIGPYGVRRRVNQSVFQKMIPGSPADKIIHYDARSYSGQFSDDGNFFFCCGQDFKVRMYDTSNPYNWQYYKTVEYPFGQWTITDASLSPDNRFLVYSSIRSAAYLASTDPEDGSDPSELDFSLLPGQSRRQSWNTSRSRFGIWSLRFSGDGREVVAGTSEDSVIVLDLETRQPVLSLRDRHQHHVNAVCFGDTSSPHILYSGSDDTTLRVWDRRSMGDGREAGVFTGHTEGLTYVDSKGDGRYVLSNSKDQTMKLWDLRKMMTASKADTIDFNMYATDFDYRFEEYPEEYREPHPADCSVVTFRGHSVLKTLIRCHFSPPGSTNSRYVYTGSEDGKVYVYNLDATMAGTIDVGMATINSRPRGPDSVPNTWEMGGDMMWRTCVRDASWHPNVPVLAATSWNGWGLSNGTCTVHSWNDGAATDEGDPPIGRSYDHKLRSLPEFNEYQDNPPATRMRRRTQRPLRSRPVPRASEEDDPDW